MAPLALASLAFALAADLATALVNASSLRGLAAAQALLGQEAWWMPKKPTDTSCLNYYPLGCHWIRLKGICLQSKDGRPKSEWKGLKLYAEPCVWCGGGACTTNSSNLCEPYDFLYHGHGVGFTAFATRVGYEVASGCGDSSDSSSKPTVRGSDCYAHPACAEEGLVGDCCPTPGGVRLGCCGNAPNDTSLAGGPAPEQEENNSWWQMAQLPLNKTDCLMDHWWGCQVIHDRDTCLGSRDGRNTSSWYGLKISGQPCVWCGGVACRTGALNLCEPLDFLMRGQGVAFHTFLAKRTYQSAECVAGHPAPWSHPYRYPPWHKSIFSGLFPTVAPWWQLPRPAEESLTCLQMNPKGCNRIQSMGECLSSRDGRMVDTSNGFRIHGEACVWCGGGQCHSNATNVCEPFDWLLHGEGVNFQFFYAKMWFKVAGCSHKKTFKLPPGSDFSCLDEAPAGCGSQRNASQCLSHRDGRPEATIDGFKVHGQPCVWCGGLACTGLSHNSCEPFDYVLNGQGQVFDYFSALLSWRMANCKNGRPAATSLDEYEDTLAGYVDLKGGYDLVPFWVPNEPKADARSCLKPFPLGCSAITDMQTCMTSLDGSSVGKVAGLNVSGEPCVWCGGAPCTTNSTALCGPFDYLMYGSGVAFFSFSAKGIYKVADCTRTTNISLPPFNYSCLSATDGRGCTDIGDAETCLQSYDGRQIQQIGPLAISGQPCVWCGGGPCYFGSTARCEAFDYALNGEGVAFTAFNAFDTFRLAACKNGTPTPATLHKFDKFVPGWSMKPRAPPKIPMINSSWWKQHEPPESELTCLMKHRFGCNVIVHEATCLGSRDYRPQALFSNSPKIYGQPCTWCGGSWCRSGSTAVCEPFDLLMHGEGKNFSTFFAKSYYQVARCKDGKPLPLQPYSKKSPWIMERPTWLTLSMPSENKSGLPPPPVFGAGPAITDTEASLGVNKAFNSVPTGLKNFTDALKSIGSKLSSLTLPPAPTTAPVAGVAPAVTAAPGASASLGAAPGAAAPGAAAPGAAAPGAAAPGAAAPLAAAPGAGAPAATTAAPTTATVTAAVAPASGAVSSFTSAAGAVGGAAAAAGTAARDAVVGAISSGSGSTAEPTALPVGTSPAAPPATTVPTVTAAAPAATLMPTLLPAMPMPSVTLPPWLTLAPLGPTPAPSTSAPAATTTAQAAAAAATAAPETTTTPFVPTAVAAVTDRGIPTMVVSPPGATAAPAETTATPTEGTAVAEVTVAPATSAAAPTTEGVSPTPAPTVAPLSTLAPLQTVAPPALPSVAPPGGLVIKAPTGGSSPGAFDQRAPVAVQGEQAAGQNETNSTLVPIAGDIEGGAGIPWYAWAILTLLLLCCIGALLYFTGLGEFNGAKGKKGKRKRGVELDRSESSDSHDSEPLVHERSLSVGSRPDLFDLMDRNHDGVISASEFGAAMGGAPMAPQRPQPQVAQQLQTRTLPAVYPQGRVMQAAPAQAQGIVTMPPQMPGHTFVA